MRSTNRRPTRHRALRGASAAAPLLLVVAACGGAAPPPVAAPTPPAAEPAPPSAAAPEAPSSNTEAVQQCLATANVKRAKFSGEPAKVGVRHVLVKHEGSKNADAAIKRTRQEACLRALEALGKIRETGDFEAAVKEYSDEPGAATRSGSIGTIQRPEVAKPFADAAFELGVNQISDIVETESGFHIIMRYE